MRNHRQPPGSDKAIAVTDDALQTDAAVTGAAAPSREDELVRTIIEDLSVSLVPDSRIVSVSYTSPNPGAGQRDRQCPSRRPTSKK